ncbi:Rieske (2Fe-2S) protein [Nocardioides panacisoli]|uniref:Rieske (2Fe-2S) protein n=1 Tax=Nocardioides panacisoli TaxID=627624 RepID=UPI001C635A86|nr:Rieske (2Fe-2S) protein [Nocardioides panacisoli]QYJ04960.1 Rieske (2Fe-2S) protein [Nocardioides panacisoli]
MADRPPMTRRCALGMLALGTSAPLVAACGSDDGAGGSTAATSSSAPSSTAPSTAATTPASPYSDPATPSGAGGGEPLVAVADVPVGGGIILAGAAVVVTQPAKGEFRGFSAICPHAQFVLSEVRENDIFCGDGHASSFALDDGSVLNGPATSPLPEVPVTVQGNQVVRA